MNICYFIQTHKNPEQIYRLITTIKHSTPDAQILIGHDGSGCELDIIKFTQIPQVDVIIGDKPAIRGDFSLITPYLNAINWLVNNQSDFDWLIYLSGQDYPTQSPRKIKQFLATTKYDGFIKYWDIASKFPDNNIRRYYYQYYRFSDRIINYFHWLTKYRKLIEKYTPLRFYLSYGLSLGIKAKSPPFNENFICYRGYQWHTLSRKCVLYIKEFVEQHPEIVKYYQRTIAPDESFIQTILVNSGLFNLSNDHKRYFRFEGSSHPLVITKNDYEYLTSNEFHFARKFDPNIDSEIFDLLDRQILELST